MILMLGGACSACGSTTSLEFDCRTPCGDRHHRMTAPARVSFYRAQMRAGNVQLLCKVCNSLKGDLLPDVWLDAICNMKASEMELNPTGTHPWGKPWSPEQTQEWLRRWLATHVWNRSNEPAA
jgi:5-methylcytosine-specific restriction endonuclease McrA